MMQIGNLAKQASVNTKTIRYYEQMGLLEEAPRSEGGYRLYVDDDLARLAFIRRARALDFSLGEIKEILTCRESGSAPCPYVSRLIHQKIAAVELRMAELEKLKRELRELERVAVRAKRASVPRAKEICHILERSTRKNSRPRSRTRV